MEDSSWISKIVEMKSESVEPIRLPIECLEEIVRHVVDLDEYHLEEFEMFKDGFYSLSSKVSDSSYPYLTRFARNSVKGVYLTEIMATVDSGELKEMEEDDSRISGFRDKRKFIRRVDDSTVVLYGCRQILVSE